MKKIFTLIAVACMAMSVNAQLINYPTSKDGITIKTSDDTKVSYGTVKIHTNTDAVDAIKIGKSYVKDDPKKADEWYYVELKTDGGFKTGDVIKIAGVYSHNDEKETAIAFYNADNKKIYTTENFINAKQVADDPAIQQYTLEADTESLFFGRSGGTTTYVTTLIITRGGEAGISTVKADANVNAPAYNLAGQQVSKDFKGVVVKNGKKMIQK